MRESFPRIANQRGRTKSRRAKLSAVMNKELSTEALALHRMESHPNVMYIRMKKLNPLGVSACILPQNGPQIGK